MPEEEVPVLSFGSMIGGPTVLNKPWSPVIRDLQYKVASLCDGLIAPLNLNIVFHIPGDILQPEFIGVRTGSYFRSKSALVVQVALPESPTEQPEVYLRTSIGLAIDEAEKWAVRRKVKIDGSIFRSIMART